MNDRDEFELEDPEGADGYASELPLTDALQNVVQTKLAEMGWSTGRLDDLELAKYIILLVENGKTREEIASELSNDLLELAPEDTGAMDFTEWLSEQIDIRSGVPTQSEENDEESDQDSLAAHVDAQSLRRDSAMSQEMRVAIGRKPPGLRASDMVGSLQLDGASSSTQPQVTHRPESTQPSPSQRRHSRLRSSSDPGEPTPVAVLRYRPRVLPTRANTTSNMSSRLEPSNSANTPSRRLPLHTPQDDLSNDEAEYYDARRRPAALHAVYYRQSPLEELATGAAMLNIQNSVDSFRRSPSSVTQFPTFEDLSIRSASNASGLSVLHVQQQTIPQLSPTLANVPEILTASPSPTSSSAPVSPSSSAAERLRAFADSFSPFMRRLSPQRRQDRLAEGSRHGSLAPPRYSLTTMPSPDWAPPDPITQVVRPRLTELAIGRSGHSFVASPSRPFMSDASRRAILDEGQENNDDMTELEEEARAYLQRMESASTQDDGTGVRDREDRTPPRQGRFMRFLGRN